MEKVDIMDICTPIFGDRIDILPPYIGGGHNGHPTKISYTEKVAGSSPVPPTRISRNSTSNQLKHPAIPHWGDDRKRHSSSPELPGCVVRNPESFSEDDRDHSLPIPIV